MACIHPASLLVLLLLPCGLIAENLLLNSDFEDPIGGEWFCKNDLCTIDALESPFIGEKAGLVQNRLDKSEGVRQSVTNIKKNAKYYVSGHVNVMNHVAQYVKVRITVIVKGAKSDWETVAEQPLVRDSDGWVHIAGDFFTKADTTSVIVMFVVAEDESVNFMVDHTSLEEVVPDPDWKVKADERIDALRKGNILINVHTPAGCSISETKFKIHEEKSSFPVGSAVLYRYVVTNDAESIRYRDYFNSLFNFATPTNHMKWRLMEEEMGNPDFERTDEMLTALHDAGIPIRGHCMAWNVQEKVPGWMLSLSPLNITRAFHRRMQYMVDRYADKIRHWDVNNEVLDGHYYEAVQHNTEFTQALFRQMHNLHPQAKLFLNEYNIVTTGMHATAYRRLGGTFKSNGVPLHVLGIQSHIRTYHTVDVDLFKKRLDVVAEAGLPIWITEFDLEEINVSERAQKMTDVLRLYFSHPAIEGIMFWGFWSKTNNMNDRGASLVDGADFIENEAGQAVRKLLREEWWTNVEVTAPTSSEGLTTTKVRAFHGTHNVTVLQNGGVVWDGQVQLIKGKDFELDINLGCPSS